MKSNGITLLLLMSACSGRVLAADSPRILYSPLSSVIRMVVSPDNRTLAFETYGPASSQGTYAVALENVRPGLTHAKRIILLVPGGRNFRWNRDRSAFVFDRPPVGGGTDDANSILYVGNKGSKIYTRVASGWMGSWAPNGKRLAFVHNHDLQVIDLRTRRVRTLLTGVSKTGPDVQDPIWMPDGKSIIFSRRDGRLWMVRSDGSKPDRLTPMSAQKSDMEPAISQDGRYLVFSRGYYGRTRSSEGMLLLDTHQLMLLNLASKRLVPITKRSEHMSDESPQWLRRNIVLFVRNGRLAQILLDKNL